MARSIDVRYGKKMTTGQQVNVRTNVRNKGVRLSFHQQMIEDGEVVNEAQSQYVPIDISGEKPTIRRYLEPDLIERLIGDQTVEIPPGRRWLA